jgi:hypothetical protein
VISVNFGHLLYAFLGLACVTFVWLLRAERVLNRRIQWETGLRPTRIRVYLSLSGILWLLCVPFGLTGYAVGEFVPALSNDGELSLIVSLLVVGLVIPLLLMRSTILAYKYKK